MSAKKNIGVLTSSRADFGIYLPLLKEIQKNRELCLSIIAFGTHLSPYHGLTIKHIESHGFEVDYKINSMLLHDDENAISSSVSLTMMKFAEFWKNYGNNFDIILCLGDRFEMFGAVYAGVPFGIKFAHIHGGETTLGAIDNTYRHAISLASHLHFVSTEEYKDRVWELTKSNNIYISGSISLHNLGNIELFSVSEMIDRFSIDFSVQTVLVTVHPETIDSKSNKKYANVCANIFKEISDRYQVVITMPNADTKGSLYR
ncbi:MAG: UDP-N-acetylglucosamine 2-epimerase, partial [Candidatus Kapaibacterium sp.]